MDNKNGAGSAFERFFAGKGFYIALLLCAVVIGVSAWTLFSGGDDVEDDVLDVYRPIVTAPAVTPKPAQEDETEPSAAVSEKPEPTPEPTPAATPEPAPEPASAPETWAWPVYGRVDRQHSVDELVYDVTMGDWRTHAGLDIETSLGTQVTASASGTVTDVRDDALYGTTVVISHPGGFESVYSNLAALPTVEIGESVEAGDVIGAVGDTAICEAGQVYHLHYEMTMNGESVDPAEYLA